MVGNHGPVFTKIAMGARNIAQTHVAIGMRTHIVVAKELDDGILTSKVATI